MRKYWPKWTNHLDSVYGTSYGQPFNIAMPLLYRITFCGLRTSSLHAENPSVGPQHFQVKVLRWKVIFWRAAATGVYNMWFGGHTQPADTFDAAVGSPFSILSESSTLCCLCRKRTTILDLIVLRMGLSLGANVLYSFFYSTGKLPPNFNCSNIISWMWTINWFYSNFLPFCSWLHPPASVCGWLPGCPHSHFATA